MKVSTKKQTKANGSDPKLLNSIVGDYVDEIQALAERVGFFAYIMRELPEEGRLYDPHNHSFADLLEATCDEIHSNANTIKAFLDDLK
ncbi:MAG: hypothetical protein MI892_20670 [Desulfobacterales bacterium]|nr:hypothetical protein [Desulfobacterales bacterium]